MGFFADVQFEVRTGWTVAGLIVKRFETKQPSMHASCRHILPASLYIKDRKKSARHEARRCSVDVHIRGPVKA